MKSEKRESQANLSNMKISYNWLKDYVDISKSPAELADDLSLFGHEAENIEKMGDDSVLDLEITPNRGDCLSVLGIAREIAALYKLKVKSEKLQVEVKSEKLDKNITIKIENTEICPRFTARIIDNVKIGESSKQIQDRLATYGFRPINNIVDITNYVMVATGQPLHAFDYDKIKDGLMRLRQAEKGEEVMTLDGQNRVLDEEAIIIEDNEKIYDLAGIMGGLKSEVDENTRTIVLQGAIFDPVLIRKTSKHLNHTTDASYRYERGVDFDGTTAGVDLATKLILDSCPEAKAGELIDKKLKSDEAIKIEFEIAKINKLLGTDISQVEANEYLERLGFRVSDNIVAVPSYRAYDVNIWQDLAEEIGRMYGYNNIKKIQNPKSEIRNENKEFQKREYIKDYLTDFGFTEIYSYSFVERDKIEALGDKITNCVEVANPLSPETQFLRPSILPPLLAAIAKNPWSPEVNIFEIEKVFTSNTERWQLGIATTDKDETNLKMRLEFLGIKKEIQKVPQNILDLYKIRRPIKYALVDVEEIKIKPQKYNLKISQNKYQPISQFAPTVRDLSFVVSENIVADKIADTIRSQDKKILLVELFDEFLFENGTKNIAFHIWLEDLERPIQERQVGEISQKVIKMVANKFAGQLRK